MGYAVKPEQQKLLLLYAMHAAAIPMLDEQLIRISDALGLMNTFELQSALSELRTNQLVTKTDSVVGALYGISQIGSSTLALFKTDLPYSKRQAIDEYIGQNKDQLKLDSQLFAEYLQIGENQFRVTLKLMENYMPTFELSLLVTSKREAAMLADGWRRNALDVYQSVFHHLIQRS